MTVIHNNIHVLSTLLVGVTVFDSYIVISLNYPSNN